MKSLRPAQIFDLRTVPSFYIGRFNRIAAFDLFEELESRYFDVPGLVGINSRIETRLKGKAIIDLSTDRVLRIERQVASIIVLLDGDHALQAAASSLPLALPQRHGKSWEVCVMPDLDS